MIKTIKISTLISTILLMSGIIFKSQHLMGAHAIFITGVAVAVFSAILIISFYAGKLPLSFERFNIIFSALVIIIVLLAFLFKIMHWPGAAKLIWVSDLVIAICALLFLIDGLREKDTEKSVLKIIGMFFILFLLLLIMLMK